MFTKKGWSIIFHLTEHTFEHMFQKGHIFVRSGERKQTSFLGEGHYYIPMFKCIVCNYIREGQRGPLDMPNCDDHCIKSIIT